MNYFFTDTDEHEHVAVPLEDGTVEFIFELPTFPPTQENPPYVGMVLTREEIQGLVDFLKDVMLDD